MKLKILKDGNNPVNTNSYLIYDEDSLDAYLIDAPTKTKPFLEKIKELNLNLKYLLLTHSHWDHIMELDFWRENFDIKVIAHKEGKQYLNNPKYNGSIQFEDQLSFEADYYLSGEKGEYDIFKYIRVPGHSKDSILLILGNIVFCGDLIFYKSVGRTDLVGSSTNDLINSIRNIVYKFPDQTILMPGHGRQTSVGYEKINNPFVPFN